MAWGARLISTQTHALALPLLFNVGFDEEVILRAEESDADDIE